MALIKCNECGKEISDKAEVCIHCGCPVKVVKEESTKPLEEKKEEEIKAEPVKTNNNVSGKKINKKIIIFGAIAIIVIFAILLAVKNSKKAIKVDISMNSWYGSIDDILDNFGIDFYAVTGGANCYSGVKTNKFETEKYGTLYTEFSYCKTANTQRFRIYNIESDQPLREPKAGELPTYNSYGEKATDSTM